MYREIGTLVMYLIRTAINNLKIYFSNRMIGEEREKVELDRKGENKIQGKWEIKHKIGGR